MQKPRLVGELQQAGGCKSLHCEPGGAIDHIDSDAACGCQTRGLHRQSWRIEIKYDQEFWTSTEGMTYLGQQHVFAMTFNKVGHQYFLGRKHPDCQPWGRRHHGLHAFDKRTTS